jgi:hypothetical protein
MVDEPSEEIIVIGDAPPDTGTGGGGGGVPTLAEKQAYADIARILTIGGLVTGGGGVVLAPVLAPAAAAALSISAIMMISAAGYVLLADEPPQPDFRRPVRITRLGLSTTSLPQPEIVEAQPLFDVFNDLIPVAKGTLDAYERAQGASLAGDTTWQTAHGHGARMLNGCATAGLLQLASRMKQFRVTDLDAIQLDQVTYSALQDRAQRGELLPGEARATLLGAGLRRADLVAFEESVANHDLANLPEGPFADVIIDTADQLHSAALRLTT